MLDEVPLDTISYGNSILMKSGCFILLMIHEAPALPFPTRIRERNQNIEAAGEAKGARLFTWRRQAATAVAAALALAMGYGVMFGHNGVTAFEQKRAEARHLQDQMQQLQQENARLRGHVDRLANDPGAIEHQAREELHYTRAGEVIYTLPASEVAPEPAMTSAPLNQ